LKFQLRGRRPLLCAAVADHGLLALTGSNDGELELWDLTQGRSLGAWKAYAGAGTLRWIYAVAMTPDGTLAVSGANDRVVKLWDLRRRTLLAQFTGESEIKHVAITADGGMIMVGEASGRVHLLRVVQGQGLNARRRDAEDFNNRV
jgi:WD40 repeat protein